MNLLAFRARIEDGYRPASEPSSVERMRARVRSAKPLFSKEERDAARQSLPVHLFQGQDVECPQID